MFTARTHQHLDLCRQSLADADVSDELRQLANDLLNHLVGMHEADGARGLAKGLRGDVQQERASCGRS